MSLRRSVENPAALDQKGVEVDEEKSDELVGISNDKKAGFEATLDVENGHLQELEVDMRHILKDQGLDDINGDSSPYPEGTL